ncbi:ribonuclease H-like protein [Xylariaceae sp. AK1471]|nr:ribonuclease H-like protein [Xylariaceae sp. AK1471]
MPKSYDGEGHGPTSNGTFEHPKHYPHRAGKPLSTRNRFPPREYIHELSICGVDYLEIYGINGFMHVRCPWASPTPCPCGRHSLHLDSLVVAVDGACPGNGTYRATKSACGVFFSPDGSKNLAFRVPDTPGYGHTSQRAELSAAIAAIRAAETFIHNGGQWLCDGCSTPCAVVHLVIKSDSAYLVNGMTTHVEKWRENGWRTTKKTEVKNQDLWTQLDDLVLAHYAATGVAIDFWLVPRDQNKDADNLANLGLERSI